MNLLETIRGNAALPQQGTTDETQKLQTLLRAKSGKQLGGSSVASSSLGEQAAVSQTNQQIQGQIAPAQALQTASQDQQSTDVAQQESQQKSDIGQSRRFDDLQTRMKTEQTLNDLSRNRGELDMKREGARLEQLGSSIRLENKQYVDQLHREAANARLNDSIGFRDAMLRTTMGDSLDLLNKDIDSKSILNDNAREFSRKVAAVDIDSAYGIFKNEMTDSRNAAMWSNGGSLVKAGLGAAASWKSDSPDVNKETDTTVAGAQSSSIPSKQQSTTSGDSFIDYMGKR